MNTTQATIAHITLGNGYELDVTYSSDVDAYNDAFTATCNETGDTLRINGWLVESVEVYAKA